MEVIRNRQRGTAFDDIAQMLDIFETITRDDLGCLGNMSSLDTYRAKLSAIGFLTKANGSGTYEVLHKVPDWFKSNDLNRVYALVHSCDNRLDDYNIWYGNTLGVLLEKWNVKTCKFEKIN